MVDAVRLAIRCGVQPKFAVLELIRAWLKAKFLALRLDGRQFSSLYLGAGNTSDQKQKDRQVAHMHPLSARTLAQEA